jgi:transcriptional regulator GlxA family with amidase domain
MNCIADNLKRAHRGSARVVEHDIDGEPLKDPRLLRALQYVTADLRKRPSLAQVAKISGLERTYFSSVFRKTVGVTFLEWNRRIRIEAAKTLLQGSDLPIIAIALAVGYDDVTTFGRTFRKCANVSPRKYRRHWLKIGEEPHEPQHLPTTSQ